jgi:hypothetical protein
VLRQELMERYGEGEAVSAIAPTPPAAARPAPAPAAPVPSIAEVAPAAAAPDEDGVVPIEQLQYSGEKALRRALELKPALDRLASDAAARAAIDEVFDLIRLGSV